MLTILVQLGLAVIVGTVLGVGFCIARFVVEKIIDRIRRNKPKDFH